MIVKHETRIRALEAEVTANRAPPPVVKVPEDEGPAGDGLGVVPPPSQEQNSKQMAPDEV